MQQHTTDLVHGAKLYRYTSDGRNPETDCGQQSTYLHWLGQLLHPVNYYIPRDAYGNIVGNHKLAQRLRFHVYGSEKVNGQYVVQNDHPDWGGWCDPMDANGEIHIHLRWYPITENPYTFPANLSHEFWHAWHFWCGMYHNQPTATEFGKWWEKAVTTNHVDDQNGTNYPWKQPDGGRNNGKEHFANSGRIMFGTDETRSNATTFPERVVPGFENTNNHPEWKKAFLLLPEACGFARVFGATNLTWQNGLDGFFQFQTTVTAQGIPAGTYIKHSNYWKDGWFKWGYNNQLGGMGWVPIQPLYTV